MRIALPPRLAPAALVAAAGACLFGFGFLAGLTIDAPWGLGPAAVCGLAALAVAAPPLAWFRRRGSEGGDGPSLLAPLTPPLAYGTAVALALAAAALVAFGGAGTATAMFWPACFGLASAALTLYGDARARSGADDDEAPADGGEGVHGEAEGVARA